MHARYIKQVAHMGSSAISDDGDISNHHQGEALTADCAESGQADSYTRYPLVFRVSQSLLYNSPCLMLH
jgi:hypothetical protein